MPNRKEKDYLYNAFLDDQIITEEVITMKAKKKSTWSWKWFLLGVLAVLAVWALYVLLKVNKVDATYVCTVSPICVERTVTRHQHWIESSDSVNGICPTNYHWQNNGNWNQRCHRNDNRLHPEHKAPIGCPTGYTGSNEGCTKDTSHWGDWGNWSTDSCVESETKKCESKTQHGNGCEWIDGPCEVITPTPDPTPTEAPKCTENCGTPPTFAGSSTEPPKCGEKDVTEGVVNPHVYRNGDVAIVKWWNTAGNMVHIYYKQVTAPDWQYSVTVPNTGYAEIKGLGTMDISFAVQQVNGCSGGVSTLSKVIVDGPSNTWVLFR